MELQKYGVNNMLSLQLYSGQFGDIRVINNGDGKPLFLANDIAKALGYSNPRKALADHCKGVTKRDTPTSSGIQAVSFIPESDVFRLVMRSKLPQAELFQDWVCEEVLPSIRKTGGYIQTTVEDTPESIMAKALLIAESTIKSQQEKIKEQAPKVLYANAIQTSNRSCLVSELSKILRQNGIEIGQNRLFSWLRNNGFLCSRGDYYNQPTQKSMELGLFEIKQVAILRSDGSTFTSITPKVTGKGQIYFVNKFLFNKNQK